MAFVRKCAKCGLDLTDTTAVTCPVCGTRIVPMLGRNIWLTALIQIAITAIFMLVFGFPKVMIVIFGTLILIGTAFSQWIKPRQLAARSAPHRPLSHPVLFRIVGFGIALSSLAFVSILLFGFVIFMNAWNAWHQYQGEPYHETDFQVKRAYYQPHNRGGADIFASGIVEGRLEWMSLRPYLHSLPHNQVEVESMVPAGTSIDIYYFPGLKGRARVQVYSDVPPSEANHRTAINAINYGLGGLALTAAIIFALTRLRRVCFVEPDRPLSEIKMHSSS